MQKKVVVTWKPNAEKISRRRERTTVSQEVEMYTDTGFHK